MGELLATFGIDGRLLLIQAVNFGVTLLVLTYFLYRPLVKVIDTRKRLVAKGVEDAALAARAKETIEGERSGIIRRAEREAGEIVDRAAEEGKRERAEIVQSAQERAEAALSDASLQAEEIRRRALKESEKEIARVAILAAEKLVRET